MINLQAHRFEVYTLVLEMYDNVAVTVGFVGPLLQLNWRGYQPLNWTMWIAGAGDHSRGRTHRGTTFGNNSLLSFNKNTSYLQVPHIKTIFNAL